MATTTTPDADLHEWANRLRQALANAPESSIAAARARQMANQARANGTLSVNLLRTLVNTLDKADKAFPEAAPRKLPDPFPNKKGQDCERCGKWVAAGDGLCERDDDDTRWMVSHAEGQCPVELLEGVPEGRYAIDWDNDDNVKFYQIKEGVLYRQASAELWAITSQAEWWKVLEAIKADPKAASILYGLKLGKCGICGRTLTNQESRERGIGPICADKMGW